MLVSYYGGIYRRNSIVHTSNSRRRKIISYFWPSTNTMRSGAVNSQTVLTCTLITCVQTGPIFAPLVWVVRNSSEPSVLCRSFTLSILSHLSPHITTENMKTIHVKINNIYNHFIYIDHQWLTWSKRNRPPIYRTICVTLNQTTVRLINKKPSCR